MKLTKEQKEIIIDAGYSNLYHALSLVLGIELSKYDQEFIDDVGSVVESLKTGDRIESI